MLDAFFRKSIFGPFDELGGYLARQGVSANLVTFYGFLIGVSGLIQITIGNLKLALFLILLNRIFDALDGAIARKTKLTSFGGFLDISLDFIIYAGVPFSFAVYNPGQNAFACCFLCFSYIGPITTFLAYAIIAAKNQVKPNTDQGIKSFYYVAGICEGSETIIAMVLMLLFPNLVPVICYVFGFLCWLTTAGRIYRCYIDFHE